MDGGDYEITLSGQNADKSSEEIASYYFIVLKK
jgi:hypothetical protein